MNKISTVLVSAPVFLSQSSLSLSPLTLPLPPQQWQCCRWYGSNSRNGNGGRGTALDPYGKSSDVPVHKMDQTIKVALQNQRRNLKEHERRLQNGNVAVDNRTHLHINTNSLSVAQNSRATQSSSSPPRQQQQQQLSGIHAVVMKSRNDFILSSSSNSTKSNSNRHHQNTAASKNNNTHKKTRMDSADLLLNTSTQDINTSFHQSTNKTARSLMKHAAIRQQELRSLACKGRRKSSRSFHMLANTAKSGGGW